VVSTREEYDHLASVYLPIGIAITVLVFSFFLFAVVRYRRRGERMPEQENRRLHWLEAVWALSVAAIVGVLLTITFTTESDVDALADDPGLEVEVTAFQWGWRFDYPESGVTVLGDNLDPPTLMVPTDTTVRFEVVARDVIHAFWIPELRFKKDVFPDRVNEFDLVFDEGTATGRCAEFCGLRHANMLFGVEAVPQDEFDSWLERRRRAEQARRGTGQAE
jgi:cytochrome c oxidase subunit II